MEGSEIGEEADGIFEGFGVWRFDPAEGGGVDESCGLEVEQHFGEVHASDFGKFAGGALIVVAFGPEPDAGTGGGAAGSSCALIGGGSADAFDVQGVDAAVGVEAGDAGESGIDDPADAVDGERCFSDVG